MQTVLLCLIMITGLNVASSKPVQKPTTESKLIISQGMNKNYTRQTGGRLRLVCDFQLEPIVDYSPSDLTIYWVKNYQELLQSKKGHVHVIRKKLSTVLILRNLESFDSGSYMCIAELSLKSGSVLLNASSETTVFVKEPEFERQENLAGLDINDYLLDFGDDLTDEFPQLNPTIVENFDDKGFCEPYKGSICSGIITGDMTIYSTSSQQQDLVEERLRSIIPLLSDSNKNNLSKQCSTFAIPSLCLFAFPLCDKKKKQPKQICRSDCRQLQNDICKNEYFNVKSLFTSGSANVQANSNFLLDCNQLPPSSDSPADCLPMISMILTSLDPTATKETISQPPVEIVSIFNDKVKCMGTSNGIDYYGTQSVTRNGFQCQRWDVQSPHKHPYSQVPGLAGHNYCRNLDSSEEPWCYTTNPAQPRDYCDIPKCTIIDTTLKNLPKMWAIAVPAGLIVILIVIIICVWCRCCRNKENLEDKSLKTSMNSNVMSAVATMGQNGNVNTHIQPNRLRMSNASLGKSKKTNQYKAGSSKSSVASSQPAHKNIEQMHPFIKNNYENDAQFQQQQQMFQQHQHMMGLQQQQQTDYTVKQFAPQNIRLLQEIGKGRFGSVYTGELIGSFGAASSNVVKATIKTLKPTKPSSFEDGPNNIPTSTPVVNNKYQADTDAAAHFNEQEFYNEISLYSSIRNRHLANLIGIHTTNYQRNDCDENHEENQEMSLHQPQSMIFEHLNNGDLHEYLLQRATSANSAAIYNGMMGSQSNLSAVSSSIGGVSSNYLNLQQQQRNVADFLYIGQQIASGMEYLSSQNFILKDLATRNILMSDNLTVKISIDLIAQYKDTYAKDYYKFQMKMLPVRWMPPESLLYGRYNQQSDVWSFGVVLYELFSYGTQPYVGSTNPEAIEMIRDRQLLPIPDDCPQRVYALMLECWHELPMQRPTFTEILNRLRNWENYYLFNNQSEQKQMPLMPPPPLPLPIHLQQQQQVPQFGMTASYSSNSQTSKASSLLGNTASTGLSSSGSPPPLPPPLQMNQHLNQQNQCYSPNKMTQFTTGGAQAQTNLFMSKFNANCGTNSLRMSQRNFQFNLNGNGQVSGIGNGDINYEL